MYYSVRLAYGPVSANHGQRPDLLFAFPTKAARDADLDENGTPFGSEPISYQQAVRWFGRRAVRSAACGENRTHICDGSCRQKGA